MQGPRGENFFNGASTVFGLLSFEEEMRRKGKRAENGRES